MTQSRRPVDPRPDASLWQEQHRRGGESPYAWLFMAQSLERATELLWNQYGEDMRNLEHAKVGDAFPSEVARPAMLLASLTVENLLKGACVAKEPAFDLNHEFHLKTHKLLDLAGRANIVLNEDEQDLVERLESFLKWAGRYPIPLSYEDMRPRTQPAGGFSTLAVVRGTDIDVWRKLVRKVQEMIDTSRTTTGQ